MSKSHISNERASLLGIPPELRNVIYQDAFDGQLNQFDMIEYPLTLTGNARGFGQKSYSAIAALPRVCKLVKQEVSSILPRFSSLSITFQDFTRDDMNSWLASVDATKLLQLRKWSVTGWQKCARDPGIRVPGKGNQMRAKNGIGAILKDAAGDARGLLHELVEADCCYRTFGINLQNLPKVNLRKHLSWHVFQFDCPTRYVPRIDDNTLCAFTFTKGDGLKALDGLTDYDCDLVGRGNVNKTISRLMSYSGNLVISKERFRRVFESIMDNRVEGSDQECNVEAYGSDYPSDWSSEAEAYTDESDLD